MTDPPSPGRRAAIAARLVWAVDAFFPHPLDERRLATGEALDALLGEVLAAPDRRRFSFACQRFLASFGNGHTAFHDATLEAQAGRPLALDARPFGGVWRVTRSDTRGLRPGDAIERIDGMDPEAFFETRHPLVSASRLEAARAALFRQPILFPEVLAVETACGREAAVARRGPRPPAELAPGAETEDGLCTLRIPSFEAHLHAAIHRALDAARPFDRLLIDLRGNGGGSTPLSLLRRLIPGRFPLWCETAVLQHGAERARRVEALASLSVQPGGVAPRATACHPAPILEGDAGAFAGPLAVLQDARTASAAEDLLIPLKATGRALLLGEKSAGTSGEPYRERLGDGFTFRVAAKGMLLPDGSRFEGVGIAPDVPLDLAPGPGGGDPTLGRAQAALRGLS